MQDTTINNKQVIVTDSVQELSDVVVSFMVQKMKASSLLPSFNVLLSTEPACERVYKRLVKSYQKGEISFHKISAFMTEENAEIVNGETRAMSKENPMSRAAAMQELFFQEVDFKEENIAYPNKENIKTPGSFDQLIGSRGGINVALCALGANGRVSWNVPGANRDSRTRLLNIAPETGQDFSDSSKSRQAFSVGIKTLFDAQEILCVAHGKSRAVIVNRVLRDPVSPALPATFLREHGNITYIIDKNAASSLGSLSNLGE